ncbi:hypothetical protein FOCC_FOCC013925 [Frankliniella occidentalis]|nr:hypothetical protein FOCC_FOCC013925 [Frankliniella occidentalis]
MYLGHFIEGDTVPKSTMDLINAEEHVDGGLINCSGMSHVIVTVQAFLHCAHFMRYLKHHNVNTCTSSQCILCEFLNVYHELCEKKISDPASLVTMWHNASCNMPLEQRSSPLFVLVVFVNLIRLSYSCGRPCESVADYEATPVAKIWKYEQETEVSCSFCGGDEQKKFKCVLELKDQSIRDLQSSVESELFNTKEEVCPLCSENEATINLRVVDMPKCLLVHLEKCTLLSPLPFELDIRGTKLSLKCIIVEPKGVRTGCYIITRCHDHRFRRFNDTQITVASPTRLSMENFYTNSNVTLMYESKVDEQWGNQVSTDHIMAVKGDNKIQITNNRFKRMRIKMLRFDPKVEYFPGKYMYLADFLSRHFISDPVADDPEMIEVGP